ncbi:hypothetical protein J15TS10_21870 [Paenibacillus woosongensis]|uniref:Uncharacterized protein n=1 Tax=Paenibacillus woosongensis TaxID=307580 RepID=A0ABQ4MR14_9BACL|nr:hypothetical protein J15TS10_21870 [Paenibacillus woosongensis]
MLVHRHARARGMLVLFRNVSLVTGFEDESGYYMHFIQLVNLLYQKAIVLNADYAVSLAELG